MGINYLEDPRCLCVSPCLAIADCIVSYLPTYLGTWYMRISSQIIATPTIYTNILYSLKPKLYFNPLSSDLAIEPFENFNLVPHIYRSV